MELNSRIAAKGEDSPALAFTEEYDGSSWTEEYDGSTASTARMSVQGAGIQTAAVVFGGYPSTNINNN